MGVGRIVYGDRTLIDLTVTTVTPETLVKGATALNHKGDLIVGTVEIPNCFFETETETFEVGSMKFETITPYENGDDMLF